MCRIPIVVSLLFALCLGGCAATHTQQTQADYQSSRAQCEALYADPALNPIRGKVAFMADQVSPSMLAIADAPTQEEQSALATYLEKRGTCEQIVIATVQKDNPQSELLIRQEIAQTDAVFVKLSHAEITYGNANSLIQQAYLTALGQYTEQVQEEQARAQQARIQALQLWQQQQTIQALTTPSPPRLTNCTWIGTQLNCMSY